jgi:hypothetical protein
MQVGEKLVQEDGDGVLVESVETRDDAYLVAGGNPVAGRMGIREVLLPEEMTARLQRLLLMKGQIAPGVELGLGVDWVV